MIDIDSQSFLFVVPALALLYTLDQRTVLEEEAEP